MKLNEFEAKYPQEKSKQFLDIQIYLDKDIFGKSIKAKSNWFWCQELVT